MLPKVSTISTNIQNNTTAINNIATGRTGLVQQDATSKVLTVGKDVDGASVNSCTIADGVGVLEVLEAARRSSADDRTVNLLLGTAAA